MIVRCTAKVLALLGVRRSSLPELEPAVSSTGLARTVAAIELAALPGAERIVGR